MKKRLASLLMIALLLFSSASPVFAVSKEIVQLQTQVQQLQDQMARMQQQFDGQMAIQKSLIEQTIDSVNKMSQTVDTLQKTLQQQSTDTGNKVDQVSGQVQALHDSVDELKARLNQINQKLDQMTAQGQNIGANVPANVGNQAPPPQTLYDNALRDYNANKSDLAMQEFADFLKFYPNENLAGNAQFYVAEIEYRQGNWQQAVNDYNKVLDQYPGGNKNAAAQLKKGFALAQLGQKDAAIAELKSLISRFPHSPEAKQAQERLVQLTGKGTRPSARRTH